MGNPMKIDVQRNPPMADKKSVKEILKIPFQVLFRTQNQKKQKSDTNKQEKFNYIRGKVRIDDIEEDIKPVSQLCENLKKLQIEKDKTGLKEYVYDDDDEDEFKNFTIIKIDRNNLKSNLNSPTDDDVEIKVRGNGRIDSNTSEDSGYGNRTNESDGDNVEVKPEKEQAKTEKREKKKRIVVIPRAPIRSSVEYNGFSSHPYGSDKVREIKNTNSLCGGQVIVNPVSQIDEVLFGVDVNVQRFTRKTHQEKEEDWDIAQEFLNTYNTNGTCATAQHDNGADLLSRSVAHGPQAAIEDRVKPDKPSVFLTPPRSEALSPQSDNYRSNSEYTLSPERLSGDYERYQEIMPFEEYPTCVRDNFKIRKTVERKKARVPMTMKQFKDMQKEITSEFTSMDCCRQISDYNAVYQSCIKIHDMQNRATYARNVANMDLGNAYGAIQIILCSYFVKGDKDEMITVFAMICHRMLDERPYFFVSGLGLNCLKTSVFLCYREPKFTRYLVTCIRAVTRTESYRRHCGRAHVFHEVDMLGDTLLLSCARYGDALAPVLGELVGNSNLDDLPLFDLHHTNADGYTALHLACALHSAERPHVHTVHVLLQHGQAELFKGDMRGGDTALHLAVNSVGCSLKLVLLLFSPLSRRAWRSLAHANNHSSVTPLEYARTAFKSRTRRNYPVEVLDFLKKCR